MSEMLEWLKEYLANTPQEEKDKDWANIKAKGFGGPTVQDYLFESELGRKLTSCIDTTAYTTDDLINMWTFATTYFELAKSIDGTEVEYMVDEHDERGQKTGKKVSVMRKAVVESIMTSHNDLQINTSTYAITKDVVDALRKEKKIPRYFGNGFGTAILIPYEKIIIEEE